MKILYLGSPTGTSSHRAAAIARLGHQVTVIDPFLLLPQKRFTAAWIRHTGAIGVGPFVRKLMLQLIGSDTYDLIWVDYGLLIDRQLVRDLRRVAPKILIYNVDDPFGNRDGRQWRLFLEAVPEYDLVVVVREPNIEEAFRCGARQVMRVFRSADEVAHASRLLSQEERLAWASKVLFAGTGFPERGPLMTEFIRQGLPLSIYGNSWSSLKEWQSIKPFWRGPGLDTGETYAAAIQSADICLGLLSKDNRDLHTTRSLEIPSVGSLFCAERTSEHLALYKDGEQAVFWDTVVEASQKCLSLLNEPELRRSIAAEGHLRYLQNGWTNMEVAANVLKVAITGSEELLRRHQDALPINLALGSSLTDSTTS